MESKKHYTGLTDAQVIESRRKHGANILTPPKRESLWQIFIDNFKDPVIRILLIAVFLSGGIAIAMYLSEDVIEIAETIGIAAAVLLATGVATWFVWDANKKFDVLNQINDDTLVKVFRNKNVREVPKKEIVVGDIVILEQGEEIPADGILLEAVSLQVNESSLTGEPMTAKSVIEEEFDREATYPTDHVMRGTTVADGHGVMEVTAVGDQTEFGKVAEKSTEKSEEQTPLDKQLEVLAKFIGIVGFCGAIVTFTILFIKGLFFNPAFPTPSLGQLGLIGAVIITAVIMLAKVWIPVIYDVYELRGIKKEMPASVEKGSWGRWILYALTALVILLGVGLLFGVKPWDPHAWVSLSVGKKILSAFMASVTLIVVTVPEGLPMSVTLSLALSMRKMLKSNNLVRKMHACETMGATTVICTDKTGTLTQNQMTVYQTNFYGLEEQKTGDNEITRLIFEGIAANTTAFLDLSEPGKIKTLGNPTEAALLLWLNRQHTDYSALRENVRIIDQLTFSTERKYMATLVESSLIGKRVLYVKGAPEIVYSHCKNVQTAGGLKSTADFQTTVNTQLSEYQKQAMRTLGFAYQIIDDNDSHFHEGRLYHTELTFLGIVAISDPIRKEVPEAVKRCSEAGIKVKMVTGDTPGTAKEIGSQIGLWTKQDTERNHITGSEFAQLSDKEALERILDLKIMSRARPTDKQRLVQLLQQKGAVVAVTGDGTNDAPALNHAHVGLSMGSGTSVAKEASDITLLDDSFSSIATAVMWGRSVYQNIQRFILFQLTINVAALIIVLLGSLLGSELPLTVTQMLWVNLIMDTFAAGALASLPPNPEVMKRKPRDSNAFIIVPQMRTLILGTGFIFVIILLGLLYYLSNYAGGIDADTPEGLRNLTLFFTVFVMLQFWNMFNAKTFGTNNSAFKGLLKSEGFLIVGLAIVIGQILVVNWGGSVFRTVPLSWNEWIWITLSTSFVLWTGELFRALKRIKEKTLH
ncbi:MULTISPECIES: calcium-translocating P-type ATPase, PMCA-type [Sanguibacteroides]|uniref:P-type Ca(2+) transporter n=1 Tax=Sanguibacteroides justesenii TaxID=1547597 RepID=A0A0C3RIN3_9PORP|nr:MULTISPECIES: calcium-translocating P-type ATPase, PMCA-type [Sanguibacteroides]KIO43695.1 haloacid dehalogenase [Sanguibacteroides justesenii]KIO45859.1 haloacid dehalogenase [Sanguibacteroides justesenii]PXZ45059.1 calcium-translocating P-type ATPase, PMCA-type [Sanguibacteroides justesenii]